MSTVKNNEAEVSSFYTILVPKETVVLRRWENETEMCFFQAS